MAMRLLKPVRQHTECCERGLGRIISERFNLEKDKYGLKPDAAEQSRPTIVLELTAHPRRVMMAFASGLLALVIVLPIFVVKRWLGKNNKRSTNSIGQF